MVDNDMTMMDEESTCCCKIARLQAGLGVVEKFVRVIGTGNGGNLEDKRDTMGRDRGGTTVGRSYCFHCLILRNIHHRRCGHQQGARWRAKYTMTARITAQEALTKGH
jgi:hypothetical protein